MLDGEPPQAEPAAIDMTDDEAAGAEALVIEAQVLENRTNKSSGLDLSNPKNAFPSEGRPLRCVRTAMNAERDPKEFWQRFAAKANKIRSLVLERHLRVAFGEIEQMLTASGYECAFELTQEEGNAVLVLTPESSDAVATEIDALLAACPVIVGWHFYGRRVKKGLADALTFVRNIYGVDLSQARFAVRMQSNGGYEVTMYSQLPANFGESDAEGLLMTFLEHALGEQDVMLRVSAVRVEAGAPEEGRLLSAEHVMALLNGTSGAT
jgi:hypothetical protein